MQQQDLAQVDIARLATVYRRVLANAPNRSTTFELQ
jgi:hypothetical protein